jgi:hypothetical protein
MKTPPTMHNGTVVRIDGNQLTTTSQDGRTYCHTMAPDVRITCDWKESLVGAISPGMNVRITTKRDDRATAVSVESGKHVDEPMTIKA